MNREQLAVSIQYLDSTASFGFQPVLRDDTDEAAMAVVRQFSESLVKVLDLAWEGDVGKISHLTPANVLMFALAEVSDNEVISEVLDIVVRCRKLRDSFVGGVYWRIKHA